VFLKKYYDIDANHVLVNIKESVWLDMVVDLRVQYCSVLKKYYDIDANHVLVNIKESVWLDMVVELRVQYCSVLKKIL